ncbi:hypothetical protein MRB53_004498 [Persea americana]|uniref:Uncharacterized protein n=1 Tax=Persea americana TaxID=3435 RepID=A0ACC2MAT1_PERAE|nr:hypothetical protein MRB53_004498 [Persea americana]
MALANNKTVMLSHLALMLSLILIIAIAESRFNFGLGKSDSTPECETVYGVGAGDTCFAVRQAFNLTTEFFSALNPNLNCEALFVGEWLCVDGTVN